MNPLSPIDLASLAAIASKIQQKQEAEKIGLDALERLGLASPGQSQPPSTDEFGILSPAGPQDAQRQQSGGARFFEWLTQAASERKAQAEQKAAEWQKLQQSSDEMRKSAESLPKPRPRAGWDLPAILKLLAGALVAGPDAANYLRAAVPAYQGTVDRYNSERMAEWDEERRKKLEEAMRMEQMAKEAKQQSERLQAEAFDVESAAQKTAYEQELQKSAEERAQEKLRNDMAAQADKDLLNNRRLFTMAKTPEELGMMIDQYNNQVVQYNAQLGAQRFQPISEGEKLSLVQAKRDELGRSDRERRFRAHLENAYDLISKPDIQSRAVGAKILVSLLPSMGEMFPDPQTRAQAEEELIGAIERAGSTLTPKEQYDITRALIASSTARQEIEKVHLELEKLKVSIANARAGGSGGGRGGRGGAGGSSGGRGGTDSLMTLNRLTNIFSKLAGLESGGFLGTSKLDGAGAAAVRALRQSATRIAAQLGFVPRADGTLVPANPTVAPAQKTPPQKQPEASRQPQPQSQRTQPQRQRTNVPRSKPPRSGGYTPEEIAELRRNGLISPIKQASPSK